MMTASLFAVALLTQTPTEVSHSFDAYVNEVKVGNAIMSRKMLDGGGRQLNLQLRMSQQGSEVSVRQETVYAKDGSQVRATLETVVNRTDRQFLSARFDERGARVTRTAGGKSTETTVVLSDKAPRDNDSIYWLNGKTPKAGEKAVFYYLNLARMEWKLQEWVFRGPDSVMLDGTKVACYKMSNATQQAWIDGQGMPLLVITEDMKLVRVMEAPNGRPPRNPGS